MCGRNEHLQSQKELPGILSHQKAVFLLPSPLSALPLVFLYLLNPRKLPLLVAEPPSVFLVLAPWHFLFTLHFSMTTSLIFHPLLPVFLFFSASFRKKNQWPAWAYCPARQPVLSFTLLLSYLFSPQSPLSQPNLCRSIPSRCSPTPLASLMFFASLFTSLSHRNFFSALSILKFYITFSVVSNPLAMFSHLKFISPLCKASLPITLPPPVVSDDFCGFSFFLFV